MTETKTRKKIEVHDRNWVEPPDTKTKTEDRKRNITNYGRTAGLLCHDSVTLGGETVEGESEPRYDPAYERQTVKLTRRDNRITNSGTLEFDGSIVWSGPVLFVVAYDEDGKEVGRSIPASQAGWPPVFSEESLDFKGKAEFADD